MRKEVKSVQFSVGSPTDTQTWLNINQYDVRVVVLCYRLEYPTGSLPNDIQLRCSVESNLISMFSNEFTLAINTAANSIEEWFPFEVIVPTGSSIEFVLSDALSQLTRATVFLEVSRA